MGHRIFKDQLYAQFARLGKALASPARLELLDLLAQGERSVEDLAREAALSVTNASAHLQVLQRARLPEHRLPDGRPLPADGWPSHAAYDEHPRGRDGAA